MQISWHVATAHGPRAQLNSSLISSGLPYECHGNLVMSVTLIMSVTELVYLMISWLSMVLLAFQ